MIPAARASFAAQAWLLILQEREYRLGNHSWLPDEVLITAFRPGEVLHLGKVHREILGSVLPVIFTVISVVQLKLVLG